MRTRTSARPKARASDRAHGVDGLDLVGREATRGATQQPAFDAQDTVLDPPSSDQPGDEPEQHEHHDDPDLDQDGGVVAVPARPGDGQDQQPAEWSADADEWRERVHSACQPDVGSQSVNQGTVISGGHKPAARASPRAVRLSRRRAASAAGNPGTRASEAAAAVCMRTVANPKARSTGPAVTSTNCIRPYGMTDSRLIMHPSSHQQVVVPLGVGPGPNPPAEKQIDDEGRHQHAYRGQDRSHGPADGGGHCHGGDEHRHGGHRQLRRGEPDAGAATVEASSPGHPWRPLRGR